MLLISFRSSAFNPPTLLGGTSRVLITSQLPAGSNLSVKKKAARMLSFLTSKVFFECAYSSAVLESIHLRTCQLFMIGQPSSGNGSFSFFFCLAIERWSGADVASLDSSESSLCHVLP